MNTAEFADKNRYALVDELLLQLCELALKLALAAWSKGGFCSLGESPRCIVMYRKNDVLAAGNYHIIKCHAVGRSRICGNYKGSVRVVAAACTDCINKGLGVLVYGTALLLCAAHPFHR